MTATGRSRDWCFTMFADETMTIKMKYDKLKDVDCLFMKYQVECCPESGREHIQGFLQIKNPKLMKNVKTLLEDKTVHLEARRASVAQAVKY